MCDPLKERIRINRILTEVIRTNSQCCLMSFDELTQLCFLALQVDYHGACLDECLEAAAREFVARRLAPRDGGAGATAGLSTAA